MTQEFILGAYTRRDNDGLYRVEFDPQKAVFSKPQLLSQLKDPTYVALDHSKKYLFAIHKEENQGGLVAFRRNAENGWEEVSRLMASQSSGCHVTWRETSQTLYVANYHEGSIDVYRFQDEQLSHLQQIKHEGSSVHPNQTSPHVHFTGMWGDREDLLFVCDLGTDEVLTYKLAEDGQLTLKYRLDMPAGTGPRHLVFHPKEAYVYVIGELNNTTSVLSVSQAGELKLLQSLPNVDMAESPDNVAGAAIRISSDGRFLYSSTRYNNKITVYAVSSAGDELSLVERVDSVGQVPRDFILDETENFLLVPHQDSDYITIFRRDPKTGRLRFRQNETYAPECVCIFPAS